MANDLRKKLQENPCWELFGYVREKEAPERLSEISINLARGYPYTEVIFIYSDEAFKGEEYYPMESGHLLYGRLSEKRTEEKRNNPYATIITVELINKLGFSEALAIR